MDNHSTHITGNADETEKIGSEIGSHLSNRRIFFLHGDLGSGKTTFAKGFAEGLGITQRILSPTFIIVRMYRIPKSKRHFYHIDLYRVPNPQSQETLQLATIFDNPNAIILIEWAEFLKGQVRNATTDCFFRLNSDGSHTIEVHDHQNI